MKQVLFAVWLGCLTAATALADNQAEFPGRIEALRQADVANAVASIVTGIHFTPGQFVRQGDPLFTLDATDFQLQLDTERANVLRAEATLKSAAADFERLSQLKERGSATGVQVLKAEVARAFADAVRAETQAALKAAETNLERAIIRAPISGVISVPQVRVGSYVKVGRGPLATIIALDRVRLSYEIPYVQRVDELDIEDMRFPLSLLDRVVLTIRIADGWVYAEQTRPDNVSATVDSATGNMTIWAELANPMGQLRPGMRVTVLPQINPAPAGD